jgi:hypothetical protein
MKNLKKLGLSALCGSLASISTANAGGIDIVGNAHMTWTSLGAQNTGNPLGMKTNMSFVGNGELDGGQTFSVLMAHNDKNAYSSSNITLNTNTLGTFKLSQAEGGGGIGGYDDNMPRAFEEVWDTGVGTNINLQKGVGSSTNLSWTSPGGFLGGTKLIVAYAPQNDGTQTNDKAVGGAADSGILHQGMDIVLDVASDTPINLFLGASRTETEQNTPAHLENRNSDHDEAVIGLKLSIGPVEIGGQLSGERTGEVATDAVEYYGNSSIGVAFNVNDNLSVSYAKMRSMQGWNGKTETGNSAEMQGDSLQVAYTLGGASLKFAKTEVTNAKYASGDNTTEGKTLALALAF